MNILQITKKFPFPEKDGESIAICNMSRGLTNNGASVFLLAMNTSKHFFEYINIPNSLSHYQQVTAVPVKNSFNPFTFFKSIFSKTPYHVTRIKEPKFESKLIEILQTYDIDIVQLESIYLADYIPIIKKYSSAKIALRNHNVETLVWERLAKQTKNTFRKIFFFYLARKIKKYESSQLNQCDFLIPISKIDEKIFKNWGFMGKSISIPVGLNINDYCQSPGTNSGISFVGALDWLPNLHGLEWFLHEVWIKFKLFNFTTLHVAGRNMPEKLINSSIPGVTFYGEIENAKEFIGKHQIMVVPLFSGSGMRIKILEAMALNKVVISTRLGSEGIESQNETNIILADSPTEFYDHITFLLNNQDFISDIGKNARELVKQNYEVNKLGLNLFTFFKNELNM
jgi:polysaccharide biosynthesis protein PslH